MRSDAVISHTDNDVLSYVTINRCVAEFLQTEYNLKDDRHSCRPSHVVCNENCKAVANIVLQNHEMNVHQIGHTSKCGQVN